MRIFFLFIFFISYQLSSQNNKNKEQVDSILFYLDSANKGNRIDFAKKSILLASKIKNDTLLRRSAIKLGFNSYSDKNIDGLTMANQSLFELYKKNQDSGALAKRFHFKALIFRLKNKLDSSYYYYNLSKDLSIKLEDSLQVGIRLKSMGEMQNNERDYLGAQATIVRALEYLEPLNDINYAGDCYSILGNIFTNIGEFKDARSYFKKAQQKFELSKSDKFRENWRLQTLNSIGYSYLVEKKYDSAIIFLNEGLSFPNIETEYKGSYKLLLGNLASCKYEIGKKEEAWRDFNKLLELREKEDNAYRRSRTHNNFAHYYILEGQNKKALFHAKKSYELSKKANHNFMTQISLGNLALLTTGRESKNYMKEYIELRNKLHKRELNLKEQFALVRYETEKTDKENVGLKLENSQKQADFERERQQKIIFALIGVIAVVISVTYFRNRRKKLMYEAQLEKASAREEERQQIAKSLHDEVAGDLRLLHQKLVRTQQDEEAKSVEVIKDNVRNLSHQLSSESFDEVSFKDQIINLISDSFSPKFRISTEGIDSVLWETINNTIKRTLYLCIRESLQNTIKYAEATKFFIRFSSEKKEILLLLEDNGKGFEEGKGKKGIGLKNLKERVEEIHGSFQIESTEQGTKTTISIPINGR